MTYGRPTRSKFVGDDDLYYTYEWDVLKSPAQYDSCEVDGRTYSYYDECPQYSQYGDYTTTVRNYYNVSVIDSAICETTTDNNAYRECDAYKNDGRTPDVQRAVYWEKIPTDSVFCTVKNGTDMRNVPKCDSLIRAFANENYISNYNNYYYSNPYNSKSYDYNYIWYTKYANVYPTSTDSLAFIGVNSVFDNESVTWASFIVLPYTVRNGDVITSDVAKADSVKIKRK